MLQNDDLERVSLLVRDLPAPSHTETACDILIQHDGDLGISAVWRLRNSAESAEFAGQMSRDVFITLNHLHEALRTAPKNARLSKRSVTASTTRPANALDGRPLPKWSAKR